MSASPDSSCGTRGNTAIVISFLGILTLGLLSPVGLVLGILSLRYPPPRTRAIIAIVIGGIGTVMLPIMFAMGVLFTWGVAGYRQSTTASTLNPRTIEIGVVGRQYYWTSVYPGPDGILWTADDIEIQDEIIVPEQTQIYLTIRSNDVLHCLFIPSAHVKKDAVPGRVSAITIDSMAIGKYDFFCTEYCGIDHSQMVGTLHVVSFQDYLTKTAQPTTPQTTYQP